ncbi:DUF5709 domain-containing protein [Leifsonia sp. P73]|uniref:DUF5709 domain-containing protein n=1 Tax=Leifsonia sp. P73 TaxID=3423959 RepID=UPI003DA3D387
MSDALGSEYDDLSDGLELLSTEESLDGDELGDDVDELSYSPLDYRPADLSWGFTPLEARTHEPLSARLAREVPEDLGEEFADVLGDTFDVDGEPIDGEVGTSRAGRIVFAEPDSSESESEFWGRDVGIDDGASSSEEAAIHIIEREDLY